MQSRVNGGAWLDGIAGANSLSRNGTLDVSDFHHVLMNHSELLAGGQNHTYRTEIIRARPRTI